MKQMRLVQALGNIDDVYIAESGEKYSVKAIGKKWLELLVAAILLLALAATAVAARVWDEHLVEFFGVSSAQQESLGDLSGYPGVSDSENGVEIQVLQTLADVNGMYVLFKITLPDDLELDENVFPGICSLRASNMRDGDDISIFSSKVELLNITGSSMTFLLHYRSSFALTAEQVKLTVMDICKYDETGENTPETIIAGVWTMEWKLEECGELTRLEINRASEVDEKPIEITQIGLSPFSVCVYVAGSEIISQAEVMVEFCDGRTLYFDKNTDGASFMFYLENEDDSTGTNLLFCSFDTVAATKEIRGIYVGEQFFAVGD